MNINLKLQQSNNLFNLFHRIFFLAKNCAEFDKKNLVSLLEEQLSAQNFLNSRLDFIFLFKIKLDNRILEEMAGRNIFKK